MSSLLGVALVVDDISKGCNLAFRYPAPAASSSSAEPAAASFHKLSPALFAKLFRPKNALCNQSFELVIDDLRFVSHPVLVTSASSASRPSVGFNGPPQPPPLAAPGASAAATTAVTTAIAAGAVSAASFSGASPAAAVAAAVAPNETTMFSVVFALEELSALAGEDAELAARRRRSIAAFRTAAAQLANGLLHEELRVGFVSREVRELLAIRDELAQHERLGTATGGSGGSGGAGGGGGGGTGGTGGSAGNNSSLNALGGHHHRKNDNSGGGGAESGGAGVDVDPQTFIDVALGKSALANDLKSVFHGLDESGTAHVVLNRWVKLSLTLSDAVAVQMQRLRPYHTLLLLADEDRVRAALPADHSQQLRLLLAAANPLKSFQDLALETSIPIHQVFRLAAHLAYWGFGRVIATITLRNIYQVSPHANLRTHSALALEFRRKFAPRELSEVLASFSGSRAISEYMKNLSALKKTEYIHMLVRPGVLVLGRLKWMGRRGVLNLTRLLLAAVCLGPDLAPPTQLHPPAPPLRVLYDPDRGRPRSTRCAAQQRWLVRAIIVLRRCAAVACSWQLPQRSERPSDVS